MHCITHSTEYTNRDWLRSYCGNGFHYFDLGRKKKFLSRLFMREGGRRRKNNIQLMSQLLLRANTNLYPIWPLLNQRAKEERKVAKEQAQVYYWMSGSFSSLNYAPLDCSVRHRKVDSWFPFFSSTYNNFSWRLSWLDRAFLLFQLKTRAKNRNTFSLHFLGKKIFQKYQKIIDFFLI